MTLMNDCSQFGDVFLIFSIKRVYRRVWRCVRVSEHRTRLSLFYLHNFKQDLMSESSFCVKWELNLTLNYSQVNHEINTENSEHNKL